jgi:hypothetical protein
VTTEQASGAVTAVVTFGVILLVMILGAFLLISTSDAIKRMQDQRQRRRADVRLARSRDCCAAHGLDVYGGDE